MCPILGRPREEIVGRVISDFTDEENTRIFATTGGPACPRGGRGLRDRPPPARRQPGALPRQRQPAHGRGRRQDCVLRDVHRHRRAEAGQVELQRWPSGRPRRPAGQERVPGQDEPRNPHAHERHPRDERTWRWTPTLDASSARYVASSARRPTHLLAIINDILDFSKIEAGKLDSRRSLFTSPPRTWGEPLRPSGPQGQKKGGGARFVRWATGVPEKLFGDDLTGCAKSS